MDSDGEFGCPFCGSQSLDYVEWDSDVWTVDCNGCDCSGPSCGSMDEAMAAWKDRFGGF